MATSDMTLESHPIDRSRVVAVYTGRQGCMCGCKGKYLFTEAMRAEGGKRRGYEVADDEVDEVEVTRVIDSVIASANVEVSEGIGDEVIYLADNKAGRRLAVYTKAAPEVAK